MLLGISAALAIVALLAVTVAIWLLIKLEHIVARVVSGVVVVGACLFLVHLFIAGGGL